MQWQSIVLTIVILFSVLLNLFQKLQMVKNSAVGSLQDKIIPLMIVDRIIKTKM